MPNFASFTTTKRRGRDEVVHGGATSAKLAASTLAAVTDRELHDLRELINDAINILDLDKVNRTDNTLTVGASLTSGSLVAITVTV